MPLRWGPGPVFVYESLALARRWQHYALRSLAVLGLLLALGVVWASISPETHRKIAAGSIHDVAQIGGSFFYAIALVQVSVVVLAAPAATAGAICLDRARGALTHMLVTDLSDAEIVLGKLLARLGPVLGLVSASLPVLAIATMLGGVDIEGVLLLEVLSVVTAAFGCALALAFSVRATRTHEVLMAVYAVWGVLILGPLLWWLIFETTGYPIKPPEWVYLLNPYYLMMGANGIGDLAIGLGVMAASTLVLVGYTVRRLRAEVTGRHRKARAVRSRRRLAWRAPSLDADPVYWREWHHARPSRMTRIVWGLFIAMIATTTAAGIYETNRTADLEMILISNALNAAFGLLLVSLGAATALSEERVRGSLDVLLTTPLSTRSIVRAKWCAMYRAVPWLALVPAVGLLAAVLIDASSSGPILNGRDLSVADGLGMVLLPVAWIVAQGAVVTSLGLLLATWFARVGRAMALSVSAYVAITFGGAILLEMDITDVIASWFVHLVPQSKSTNDLFQVGLGSLNPIFAQVMPAIGLEQNNGHLSDGEFWGVQLAALAATAALAAILYGLTLLTFERCLGRVSERPRRPIKPPERPVVLVKVAIPEMEHVTAAHSR